MPRPCTFPALRATTSAAMNVPMWITGYWVLLSWPAVHEGIWVARTETHGPERSCRANGLREQAELPRANTICVCRLRD